MAINRDQQRLIDLFLRDNKTGSWWKEPYAPALHYMMREIELLRDRCAALEAKLKEQTDPSSPEARHEAACAAIRESRKEVLRNG